MEGKNTWIKQKQKKNSENGMKGKIIYLEDGDGEECCETFDFTYIYWGYFLELSPTNQS